MTVLAAEQRFRGDPDVLPSLQARLACRAGMATTTAGVANGFVQATSRSCRRNLPHRFTGFASSIQNRVRSSACPTSATRASLRWGSTSTFAPTCRATVCGATAKWWRSRPTSGRIVRDDLVAFVLGCSFSFEEALMADDLPIRHIECKVRVPIVPHQYRMQPIGAVRRSHGGIDAAVQAGGCDPRGADHLALSRRAWRGRFILGHPHSIGIEDIAKPDTAMRVPVEADEIPVFWACGVTPQAVIAAAKLPFAITHAPGLMLVTDLRNKQLAVL